MKVIDVLIVVDVENALAQGLPKNVYLIDTNKYFGSGQEGQAELQTACHDGQTIRWNITPVSNENNIEITSFTGNMVKEKICIPKQTGSDSSPAWQGRVETQGAVGKWQYSVVVSANGKSMTFDPFLVVNKK